MTVELIDLLITGEATNVDIDKVGETVRGWYQDAPEGVRAEIVMMVEALVYGLRNGLNTDGPQDWLGIRATVLA